jgi:hypothetical protein
MASWRSRTFLIFKSARFSEAYRKVVSARRSLGFSQHKLHQHARCDEAPCTPESDNPSARAALA